MPETIGEAVFELSTDASKFDTGLDKAEKDAGSFGDKLAAVGKVGLVGAVAGVAAVGAGLTKGVANAVEFEKGMRDVNTLVGADEQGFKKLQQDLLNMSSEMGLATDTAVPALYQAISSGVPPENVFKFMEESAQAAIGGSADLGDVIAVTTSILKGYGMEMTDAATVQDQLQKVVALGVTTLPELAASMGKVTPMASALGVPLEELNAGMATLTGVTGNTAEVATQLRATYQAMLKPTADMATAIANVSEDLDAQGKLMEGPLTDSFRSTRDNLAAQKTHLEALEAQLKQAQTGAGDFEGALLNMKGALDQSQVALQNQKSTTAALKMELKELKASGDASEEAIADLEARILSSQKAEMSAKDNVAQLKIAYNGLKEEGKLTATGIKNLEKAVKDQSKAVKDADSAYQEAAAGMGQMIVKSVGAGEAINLLNAEAEGNTNTMGKMWGSVEAINAVMTLSGAQSEAYTEKLAAMKEAQGTATEAFDEMEKSASRQWETMKVKLSNVLTNVGLRILPLVSRAMGALIPWIDKASTFLIDKLIPAIISFSGKVWRVIVPIKSFITQLVSVVASGTTLQEKFTNLGTFIFDWFKDTLLPDVKIKIGEVKDALIDWVGNVWPGLKEKATTLLSDLKAWFTDTFIPDLKQKAIDLKNAAVEWVADVWPDMKEKLVTFITDITGWYTGTYLPFLLTKAGELKDLAVEWVPKIWEAMKPKIVTFLSDLKTWLTDTALPEIKTKFTEWKDAAIAWVSEVWPPLKIKALAFLTSVRTWLTTTALPKLKEKFIEWKDAAVAWVADVWPDMKEKAATLLSDFATWISDALPTISEKLVEWGGEFTQWITDAIPLVTEKLSGIIDAIFNWITTTAAQIGPKLIEWIDAFTESVENIGTEMEHPEGMDASEGDSPLAKIGSAIFGFITTLVTQLPGKLLAIIPPFTLAILNLAAKIVIEIVKLIPPFTLWIATKLVPALGTALLAIGTKIIDYIKDPLLPDLKDKMADLGTQMAASLKVALENGIRLAINGVIGMFNVLIDKWNGLSFTIPKIGISIPEKKVLGKTVFPGLDISAGPTTVSTPNIPRIPTIPVPTLDEGGITTEPTFAALSVNEVPEAIVPLDRAREFGFGGGKVEVNIYGDVLEGVKEKVKEAIIELDETGVTDGLISKRAS